MNNSEYIPSQPEYNDDNLEIERQLFWAVPWDGTRRHPNAPSELSDVQANYLTYSINHLADNYEQNFKSALDKGWIREGTTSADIVDIPELDQLDESNILKIIEDGKHSDDPQMDKLSMSYKVYALKKLVERSLFDSHIMRLQRNADAKSLSPEDMQDELVQRVANGMAPPEEVLRMVEMYPEVVSSELAKNSFTLNYSGAVEVRKYVDDMMREHAMSIESPELAHYVRSTIVEKSDCEYDENLEIYKTKLVDVNLPAAVIERKKIVGYKEVHGESLAVVQRLRLLVRGDEDAAGYDEYLDRKIKNEERHEELFDKVRESLPNASDDNDMFRWLQPISMTYYAYYPERVAQKNS